MLGLFFVYTNGKHHHSESSTSAVGFHQRHNMYIPQRGGMEREIVISEDEEGNGPVVLGPFLGNLVEEPTIEQGSAQKPRPKRNCGDRSPSIGKIVYFSMFVWSLTPFSSN